MFIEQLCHDCTALRACTLTCKAWRRTSRRLLWQKLEVSPDCNGRPGIPPSLCFLLAEYPEIAQLVFILSVHLTFRQLPWLSRFNNLKELTIKGCWNTSRNPAHSAIPEGFQMLAVTKIELLFCGFPSSASVDRLLACFPSVSCLYLIDVAPNIEHALGGAPPFAPIALPHLRRLEFLGKRLVPSLSRIVLSVGDALEHLTVWSLPGMAALSEARMDISQNTCLEELKVGFGMDASREGWGDSVAALLAQLSVSHTALLRVELYASVCPSHRHDLQARVWNDLGPLLGHQLCRILDELPRVTLVFGLTGWHIKPLAHEARTTLARHLSRRCPGLGAHAQRLRFKCNADDDDCALLA